MAFVTNNPHPTHEAGDKWPSEDRVRPGISGLMVEGISEDNIKVVGGPINHAQKVFKLYRRDIINPMNPACNSATDLSVNDL